MASVGNETIDRLYGLPLDEFVAERNELAKRLRKEGAREEAAAVAKLLKPSVAAWAANQVLRSQPTARRALVEAGEALERAQSGVLSGRGGGRDALRKATAKHRDALRELADAARGLLDSDGRGLTEATVSRMVDTLRAVSLDPDARAEAADARLVKERTYAGFGFGDAAVAAAEPAPRRKRTKPRATPKRKADPKPKAEKRPTAAQLRKQAERVERAQRRLTEAEKKLRGAERDAQRAATALERATAARDRAAVELERLSSDG